MIWKIDKAENIKKYLNTAVLPVEGIKSSPTFPNVAQ